MSIDTAPFALWQYIDYLRAVVYNISMTKYAINKGDKLSLYIIAQGTFGEGIARTEGYTVFVVGALVGEQVLARIDHVKKGIAYASIVDITTKSSSRVAPPCQCYTSCGGCQLQHMDYTAQLQYKHDVVANNLAKIGKIDYPVLDTVASSQQYHYRNKIALPVGGVTGNISIGMYSQGTHNIVPISSCMLVDSWADDLINIVRSFANEHSIPPYNESDFSGVLRHVVARYVDGQLLVTLVTNGTHSVDYTPLCDMLGSRYSQWGLFVNINSTKGNVILGDTTHHIAGIDGIHSQSGNIRYTVQPESFFQVNDDIRTKIYAKARQLLLSGKTDVLIDCFSGVGLLTSAMYSDSYDTYAIEIDSSSVADANKMKDDNNLVRLNNICGDANVQLPKLLNRLRQSNSGNISLLVDPPRKGLGTQICSSIIDSAPTSIVYISCDSATLARDLAMLSSSYNITHIEPYDMFPNTRHVETLVAMTIK